MEKEEMISLIIKLIKTGEKIDVEFKKSRDKLNKDLYESVCSFNNRNGGHIILGVEDKTKEVVGVNPDEVDKMKKDFTTAINNSNKINPPMYLTPEDYKIDGKTIIYIRVPEGTQVRRLNGRIFDRTYEGDIDITDNAELVYKLYARKQSTYFVNKVFPNLGLEFLDFDVIRRAKKMAMSRVENHPWTNMSEEDILRSSGLILTDPESGKEGITLAAILLFGKDSTIMSVLPQYKTDAIYRVKNMDRYDDREIGYADELGSGMRNTNKYTKLYSGGVPKFVEENTFEIIIPIENVPDLQVGGNVHFEENRVPKSAGEVPKSAEDIKIEKLDAQQSQVYTYVLANKTITTREAKALLGVRDRRARKILSDMCEACVLEKVGATSNLKYILKKRNN